METQTSSIMYGLIIGGLAPNLIASVFAAFRLFAYSIFCVALSLCGYCYAIVPGANTKPLLSKYFRDGCKGVHFKRGKEELGLFFRLRGDMPFISYWQLATLDNSEKQVMEASPAYRVTEGVRDDERIKVTIIVRRKDLDAVSGTMMCKPGPKKSYTGLSENDPFVLEYKFSRYSCLNTYFLTCPISVSRQYNYNSRQMKYAQNIADTFVTSLSHSCVALLYGDPGSGKSTLAAMVAALTGGILIDTDIFRSQEVSFNDVYTCMNPTPNTPLVLRYDEINTILEKLVAKPNAEAKLVEKGDRVTIERDKDNITKRIWNMLFDYIDSGFYPNTILIMTMNTDPTTIDVVDSALLRDGRINIRLRLDIEKDKAT